MENNYLDIIMDTMETVNFDGKHSIKELRMMEAETGIKEFGNMADIVRRNGLIGFDIVAYIDSDSKLNTCKEFLKKSFELNKNGIDYRINEVIANYKLKKLQKSLRESEGR